MTRPEASGGWVSRHDLEHDEWAVTALNVAPMGSAEGSWGKARCVNGTGAVQAPPPFWPIPSVSDAWLT